MRFVLFLLVASAALSSQDPYGGPHTIKVPDGCPFWVLAPTFSDAWFQYDNRSACKDAAFERAVAGWPRYSSAVLADVKGYTNSGILVEIDGKRGFVVRELVDMSREAKDEAETEATRRAGEEKARTAEKKERALIAALPRVRVDGTAAAIAATSPDCAKDLREVLASAQQTGTGVVFRKKMADLAAVGCTVAVPSGTRVEVLSRLGEFSAVKLRTGPLAGRSVFLLSANLH